MKRDGRTLDHRTLEEIRRMAVQRVWDGERPSVVIASYGFARPVIYRWLRDARGKGRGLRALRSRKGTGRPRRLAPKQEQQLFRWINGKDPRQHGFDFGLWTRLVVRKLIADKFGANLGVTAVGKLLAKLGLTPQKPLKRAYERDPTAIEAWKRDTYPSIAGRAKRRGAEIYFWDESGFRADVNIDTNRLANAADEMQSDGKSASGDHGQILPLVERSTSAQRNRPFAAKTDGRNSSRCRNSRDAR